jgi:hypothetical protein
LLSCAKSESPAKATTDSTGRCLRRLKASRRESVNAVEAIDHQDDRGLSNAATDAGPSLLLPDA